MAAMPPIALDASIADALADAPAGGCAGAARIALGPGVLLGAVGLLQRADAPADPVTCDARVDVLVHLRGGQATVVHCLSALHAQSLRPRRIRLVEDLAARDGSAVLAREFAKANRMPIELVQARGSRRAQLAEQAAQLDGDVLVVLDAHTVLDSRHYLERCVRALQAGAGIGSACGGVLPLRDEDRRRWAASDTFRRWLGGDEWRDPARPRTAWGHAMRWLGESYRECVGIVQQRAVQRGQMRAFGSICHPAGAIAYRRPALAHALAFDGDAAESTDRPEEIGVGFALARDGFRAVHVADAVARVRPPRLAVLVAQRMRYTRRLLLDAARLRGSRQGARPSPVGRVLASTLIDKLVLPVAMLALLLAGAWGWFATALAVDTGAWLALLVLAAPRARVATLARGVVVAPLRYLEIAADAAAVVKLALERRALPRDPR